MTSQINGRVFALDTAAWDSDGGDHLQGMVMVDQAGGLSKYVQACNGAQCLLPLLPCSDNQNYTCECEKLNVLYSGISTWSFICCRTALIL